MDLPVDITRVERGLAREQIVQSCPQGIDVVQMCATLPIELLRAHINKRPASALFHREQLERLSQSACNPKVRNLEIAALIHHQVAGFRSR